MNGLGSGHQSYRHNEMRAVLSDAFGPVEQLRVTDIPIPEPSAHEVLVRVHVAGANYPDALICEGRYQIRPTPPFIPGGELAGEIVAVGTDVDETLLGQRIVAARLLGAFAEFAAVPAAACVALPDNITFAEAGTLAHSFGTALFAVRERGKLSAGESVLVLGAGSGVGYAAVQLARHLGASLVVAGASTPEKRERALEAGADLVFDPRVRELRSTLRSLVPGGVDVVIDPIGGPPAEACVRSLQDGGRYVVVGFASGQTPAVPFNLVLLRNRAVIGAELGSWARHAPDRHNQLLNDVVAFVAAGLVSPAEPEVFSLADTGQALSRILAGTVGGRIGIEVHAST